MAKIFNSRSEQLSVVGILSVLTFCIVLIVSIFVWGNPKPASFGGASVAAAIMASLGTSWVFASQKRRSDGRFGGKSLWMLLLVMTTFSAGCVIVRPSDAALISRHRQNAEDIAQAVAADPTLPPYAKKWWDAEARTWRALEAWAHGDPPPTTP